MRRPRTDRWPASLRQAVHPPIGAPQFWLVQIVVVALAAVHLSIDITSPAQTIPAGVPVALLLAPVSYAALRYGLSGSVATAVWATLLWLPDLLLPHDRGHVGNDLIELALVIAVAMFVGRHIDAERTEHAHAERARSEQLAAEARYRQLFDTNAAPILVAGRAGAIVDANPAARALVRGNVIGMAVGDVLGRGSGALGEGGGIVAISAPGSGLRHFRVNAAQVTTPGENEPLVQLVLLDVTEERAEGERVHRFAELLLLVQEDERRRIAQELHDEPLQLLVHLARSLELLATGPSAPAALADDLQGARRQTLEVAARVRAVVAGLRPPALEQLGLAPALRGFLADVGDTTSLAAELRVTGNEDRLPADIELAAFRVAQEAVNNVVRHADARKLVLSLDFEERGVRLSVVDDGQGFDPAGLEATQPAGRFGILGMRERAALAGGELTVHSAPGQGTAITVALGRKGPVPGQAGLRRPAPAPEPS